MFSFYSFEAVDWYRLNLFAGKDDEEDEEICGSDGSSISVLPEHIDKRRRMINILLHAAGL